MNPLARRACSWLRHPPNLLFAVMLPLMLAPLWSFKYFPSVDGPSHLYTAHVLGLIDSPDGSLFRQYYDVNKSPEPNWLTPLMLAGLMKFVPPLAAQKILLGIYVLLLPLAARYALGAFGRRARDLSLLIFPLVYNWMVFMGFYNFIFSLALYFFVIGFAARRRLNFGAADACILAAWLLVLYFCHLVSFVQVAVILPVVWMIAPPALRAGPNRWLLLGLSFAPALALAAWFLSNSGIASQNYRQNQLLYFHAGKIRRLFDLYYTLVVFRNVELIWTTIFAAGLLIPAFGFGIRKIRDRRWRASDLLLVAAAIYAASYFLAPHEVSQVELVYPRIAIYFWFALMLWLAVQPLARRAREALAAIALLVTLALLYLHSQDAALWNSFVRDLDSLAPRIEPSRTIYGVTMRETTPPPMRVDQQRRGNFEAHLMAYLAIERRLVDLTDHEGSMGYGPLKFRADRDPADGIRSSFIDPFDYAFEDYQSGPGRIDYLVVCRIDEPPLFSDKQVRIIEQIHSGFEKVASSEPLGLFELYRARD